MRRVEKGPERGSGTNAARAHDERAAEHGERADEAKRSTSHVPVFGVIQMYGPVGALPNAKGTPRNLAPGKAPTGPYIWMTPKTGT